MSKDMDIEPRPMQPFERAWHFLVEWTNAQQGMDTEDAKRELQRRIATLFSRIDDLESVVHDDDASLPTAEDVRGIMA